jgi:hypothetical protein
MKTTIAGLPARIAVAGAVVAALMIGGCSESTAPTTLPRGLSVGPDGRPDLRPSALFGGLRSTTFTLTSAGGSFDVGMFNVNFPANSVCDPTTSSYGPGTWDSPCATLGDGQSITVTATYGFTLAGGPVVDFSPALRFSPNANVVISTDAYALVLTFFRSYWLANPGALRYFGMYYTPDFGATSFTDAGYDISQATHVNLTTGLVWRRIKHFSGYNVTSGLPCDPSPDDPDCIDTGGPMIDQ